MRTIYCAKYFDNSPTRSKMELRTLRELYIMASGRNILRMVPRGVQRVVVACCSPVYISLRRTTNGHICTLDSGGVLALHL
jgi:hypothetical protein